MTAHKLELLQNYERYPAKYAEQAVTFKAAMEKARAENADPKKAIEQLIEGVLKRRGGE
jgi:hypothetical protein